MRKPLRVGIVAAEASADQLGATVVEVLQKQYPGCEIVGIAGPQMQALGVLTLWDASQLSVMGLTEVLPKLLSILKIRRQLLKYFLQQPPDLFIGIDAPDFNLGVEEKLRKQGIKVLHYVSPSVWAWKAWRIHKIKRATNNLLCLFPFEVDFYRQHGHPAVFVGHPLAEKMPLHVDKTAAKIALQLDPNKPCLAVLPGSRQHELKHLLPAYLKTIALCKKKLSTLQVILPLAHAELKALLKPYAKALEVLGVQVLDGKAHAVLLAADAALVASGTATLEAMLAKTPMVVAYRLSCLSFWVARCLVKIRRFALPNILANKRVVPEFMQQQVVPQKMADALLAYLHDPALAEETKATFTTLHQALLTDTKAKLAHAIENLMEKKPC